MGWEQNSIFQLLIVNAGQPNSGLFVYNGIGGPGNPPVFCVVAPGVTTDPYGNSVTSSKILIQGSVITESGGIFRTNATAPLIQLDGVHNAFWVYDASANLIASVATAAGNDGIGHNYLAGITSYTPGGGVTLNLLNGTASFIESGDTNNAIISRSPGGTSLNLSAATTASQVVAAAFALATAASGVAAVAILSGPATLVLNETGTDMTAAVAGGPQIYGNGSGHLEAIADSTNGDSNNYDLERLTLVCGAVTINSAVTRVNVFSKHLGTGTYKIRLWIVTQNTTAADAAAWSFNFSGTATGLADITTKTSGTATVGYAATTTPFGALGNGQGVAGNQSVECNATLVVTAAGTLTFGGLELVAGNTVTVSAGGQLDLYPVVAT